MLNITHIVYDEKFIDGVMSFFDDVKTNNTFYCIVSSFPYELKYIKKRERVILILEKELVAIINNCMNYDAIYFHCLPAQLYKYVVAIPNDKKVIWSSWGSDIYYPNGLFPEICKVELYKPQTKSYLYPQQKISYFEFAKHVIKNIVFPVRCYRERKCSKKQKEDAILLQKQVLKRIDYCSTVIDSEYDMLANQDSFTAKMIPSPYVMKRNIRETDDLNFDKTDYILLGNSADPSNNYLDLILLMENRHIKNKIYLPLAYGNAKNKEYLIKKLGDNEKYILQKSFVSIDEYWSILKNARVVVMGHIRQQALGNITQSLYYGHKVFLYEDSIAYKYFIANGVYVFSIEKDLFQYEIDVPLERYKIEYNRNFILRTWDYDNRVKTLREILCVKSKTVMY